jgi:alkylation response protein AidB-like acyl-CoA dehydrogenase
VNFEFDDDHYARLEAVGRYLHDNAGPATLRRFWDEDSTDTRLWEDLAGLGVMSLTVPESHHGQGLGLCDISLIVEELGRHAVPHPIAECMGIVTPLIARFADEAIRSDWLPRIGAGRILASVQDGWRGQAPWGRESGLVLVLHDEGVSLCVPSGASVAVPSAIDPARRPARICDSQEIARLAGKAVALAARQYARVVVAQLLLGLSAATIARAVEYAKTREQFGRPIGSFQAVKHQLANAHVSIETARRATWFAAWCIDHDDARAAEAVAVAKGSAAEAAVEASYAGLQVHGAMGYTWECDLHLWTKRIHVLEGQFGGAREQWRELADMTFGTEGEEK